MKNLKRMIALLLAIVMVLAMAACSAKPAGTDDKPAAPEQSGEKQNGDAAESGSAEGKDLSWLNSSKTLPLVKEGTEKKLSLYIKMGENTPDPESTWMFRFIENAMNINIEVTKFTDANRNEIIPLAFASGELPDLIIGGGFTAEELVNYGTVEGQIMDLSPYMNETYMPNLTGIYTEHPEYKSAIQDGEGHIWSVGYITDPADCQNVSRAFLNYDWLEKCGKKVPTTLDELLDVLRAFKQENPDCYPLGGSWSCNNPSVLIFNALGYLTSDPSGMSVTLRNGEVVLPVDDHEAYGAYLEFMKTCYDEGLIHPDFFTMDISTTNAVTTEGLNGYIPQAPFLYNDNYREFWGPIPLTSEYNSTSQWPVNLSALSCGGAVVSSECQEPELAATFLDWFYTFHTMHISMIGPNVDLDPDYLYGVGGWKFGEDLTEVHQDMEGYLSNGEYVAQVIQLWSYGTLGTDIYDGTEGEIHPLEGWMPDDYAASLEDPSVIRLDESISVDGQHHYMMAQKYSLCYHLTSDVFPPQVYFDAETATKVNNLKVILSDYAESEMAKFITGARSLDELDNYFNEIEKLGATEYVQYYRDYYEALQ